MMRRSFDLEPTFITELFIFKMPNIENLVYEEGVLLLTRMDKYTPVMVTTAIKKTKIQILSTAELTYFHVITSSSVITTFSGIHLIKESLRFLIFSIVCTSVIVSTLFLSFLYTLHLESGCLHFMMRVMVAHQAGTVMLGSL